MLDKNGRPLKGGAVWLRTTSLDGGLKEHNKKVAMEAFEAFLDSRSDISATISQQEVEKRRKNFKIINGNNE